VRLGNKDLTGAIGMDLPDFNSFLVANVDKITLYDSESFKKLDEVRIKLLKANKREPN
jgi:hypothetical protein